MASADVVRRVLSAADQGTRVACCLASKRVFEAVCVPGAWREVFVYDPSEVAAQFIARVRPETVVVCCPDVARVERFFDAVASEGGASSVRSADVRVGDARYSHDGWALLAVLEQFGSLETVHLQATSVRTPACVAFPSAAFPKLRCVDVLDPSRGLEVYFRGAKLPALEKVALTVRTSDVLAHASRFPALKHVHYDGAREAYDDAVLEGVRLEQLTLRASCWMATSALMAELARAKRIEALKVVCEGDVAFETYIPVDSLEIVVLTSGADVEIVHPVVRGVRDLMVRSTGDAFTIRFLGTGSWTNFARWTASTRFHVGLRGRVVVDT